MQRMAITLCSLALALLGYGTAQAQDVTRIRGTVSAFDGKSLSVKGPDGKVVEMEVTDKTDIVFTQPIKLADIKSGDFLAITSRKRQDGTLTAYDVRRFPKPSNPGHRPFDGKSDETMTNAEVSAVVQSTNGHELTMTYDGGSQKIVVPGNASISALVPGQRSQLVAGAPVFLTAAPGEGGKLTASRIQVSPAK